MKLSIKKKDKIRISFNENYTTGYRWNFDKNQNVIDIVEKIKNPETNSFGGPIIVTLEITGLNLGSVVYEFKRPWLPDSPPEKTIEVVVNG